jgi:hypothetical protein
MEPNELLVRFRQFQKAVMVLLAAILVLCVVAFVVVWVKLNAIAERATYVRCSGSSFSGPPADGVVSSSMEPDLDLAAQGVAGLRFAFTLASKIPGSEVILAYKTEGQDQWKTVPMTADRDEPLTYKASVPVGLNDRFIYRLEQVVGGEIVHASIARWSEVGTLVGNGDAYVELYRWSGKPAELRVYQHPYSKISALQIAEVRLKINRSGQKQPEEHVLKDEDREDGSELLRLEVSPEGIEDVDVTVVYKDGESRTATFNPYSELPQPLIKR